MEKVIKELVIRSELLKEALAIAKVCDAPEIEDQLLELNKEMDKSQKLLERRKNLMEEKKTLTEKLMEMKAKINKKAEKLEKLTERLNNELSSASQTQKEDNNVQVSPCPSEWANGALDTPVPNRCLLESLNSITEDDQNQYIKLIDTEEMRSVPGYMKGRLTCENVNSFIDTLNSVLKNKYDIVNLKRKDVKRKDLIQYSEWKSQEDTHKMTGKVYFTQDDLMTLGNTKMDKTADKIFQVLRHTKRIRQSHINKQLVLFIVV